MVRYQYKVPKYNTSTYLHMFFLAGIGDVGEVEQPIQWMMTHEKLMTPEKRFRKASSRLLRVLYRNFYTRVSRRSDQVVSA